MKRICESCKKEVKIKEHYFEVIEYKDKKELSKKYVHKNCQDNYTEKLKNSLVDPSLNDMAKGFLKNANEMMKKMSGETQEVFVIK